MPRALRHGDLSRRVPPRSQCLALGGSPIDLNHERFCSSAAGDQAAVFSQPAPARSPRCSGDPIGEIARIHLKRMPAQQRRQRRPGTGGIAGQEPHGGQTEPGFAHVLARQNLLKQHGGTGVVDADQGGAQEKADRSLRRRQAMGAIEPTDGFHLVTRTRRRARPREGVLDQQLMFFDRPRPAVRRHAPCVSIRYSAASSAGGKAARSAFASCNPCDAARSSQKRASAGLYSPATDRSRKRPNIICACG